jgi:hypothetical protein
MKFNALELFYLKHSLKRAIADFNYTYHESKLVDHPAPQIIREQKEELDALLKKLELMEAEVNE